MRTGRVQGRRRGTGTLERAEISMNLAVGGVDTEAKSRGRDHMGEAQGAPGVSKPGGCWET